MNDDGKVRISEIISNAQQDPRCIFDIHGEIGLFLEAFLKVDLFFFSIEKTWRFAEITLFEFTITCPEPELATLDGAGTLTLNLGVDAEDRKEIDTSDNAETFIVRHLNGDENSEEVEVQWSSWKQTFSNVKKILVNDAGAGDDVIDTRGVKVDVEIHGGPGNDTIYASDGAGSVIHGDDGNDTITASDNDNATGVIFHGGAGNDLLTAGPVAITIYGDGGNDTITGSPEADILYGNDGVLTSTDGADTITGGDGNDEIHGGLGNDTIEGGADDDWIYGDGGNDVIRGSRGDDILDGGEGDDSLYGSAGNDLLIGGPDDDWANGHGGTDLLIGENFATINGLALTPANLAGIRAALGALPVAGITVHGLTGADVGGADPVTGNDLLIGGGYIDALFGGPGNDYLYGGNFLNTGETDVIEEDQNDFFDGGPGDDTIFGDDAMGRTGDRDTGIALRGAIFFDLNKNGRREDEEVGFGGVTVSLYRNDGVLIDSTDTESDGAYSFTGLDPDLYYLIFESVPGMNFIQQFAGGAANAEAAGDDSDAYPAAPPPGRVIGQTPDFTLTFDETETFVTAGYEGDPIISIGNVSVNEGDDGQTEALVTVNLSGPQVFLTSVNFATADGNDGLHPERNALAGTGDYDALSGRLEFGPGEVSKTITIVLHGDTTYEEHQQFRLLLSNPSAGVQLQSSPTTTALVTIINDDPVPEISIADFVPPSTLTEDGARIYTAGEGTTATFVISLSNPSQYPVKVNYLVDSAYTFGALEAEGAAHPFPLFPDGDYFNPVPLPVVFQPGETRKSITVQLRDDAGDPIDEYDEHFFVDLYNPEFARIADGRAYGIVPDDDPEVGVTIAPLFPVGGDYRTEVVEGNGSTLTTVPIVISLSKASAKQINVTWATSPGTAVEAVYQLDKLNLVDLEDYVGFPRPETPESALTVRFAPFETTKTIYVTINGDNFVEGNEMFFVNLISADNSVIAPDPTSQSNHVTIVITDDDTTPNGDPGPWAIRFSDVAYSVQEPDSGTAEAKITLLRAPGSSHAIAVFYTTNGSATAGADYDGYFRELVVFGPNELSRTITIKIHSDNLSEGDETVLLSLRNPTGGRVRGSPDNATLTIHDEDVPVVSIEAPSFPVFIFSVTGIVEGNPDVQTSTEFKIKLSKPAPPGGVFVDWQTVSLTARAGLDFVGASGTAFIASGGTDTTVTITVTQDLLPELTEKFAVRLSDPVRATLSEDASAAIAPIYDDDFQTLEGLVFYDRNGNGFVDLGENGIENVTVNITYYIGNVAVPLAPTTTDGDGKYFASVPLGQVVISVDGQTVQSPYQKSAGPLLGLDWSGEYFTTTENEVQSELYDGIVGLSPFSPVGYKNSLTRTAPSGVDDVGRGGTDDTIFGGPGNDVIDAGAGDDHVVGGHWQTATDMNMPVNQEAYDAEVIVVDENTNLQAVYGLPLGVVFHPIYDAGPIFSVDPQLFPGVIAGQIWRETDTNKLQLNPGFIPEPLFTEEVLVHLLDGSGNPVNSVVTHNGLYVFDNLYVDASNPAAESLYIIQFELPDGWTYVEPNTADGDPDEDASPIDSDAELVDRTRLITITAAVPTENDIDAGVLPSATIPQASGIEFSRSSYSVYEKEGFVEITLVRESSYAAQSVLVRTYDGTGPDGATSSPAATKNFTAVTRLIHFPIGETVATFTIPIFNRHLGITDFRYFTITMHDPTGRRLDETTVYIVGEGNPTISDDDDMTGGGDWDILMGDSALIPGYAVTAEWADLGKPEKLGNIKRYGGPGDDVIRGEGGADYLDAQLGDDILEGGDVVDIALGGLGDDQITVGQGNDDVRGDHGKDTLLSRRSVSGITLAPTTLTHQRSDGTPLNIHALRDAFEVARLFGDAQDNSFNLNAWNNTAFVAGGGGDDSLAVTNNTNMILRDATPGELLLYLSLYSFPKDASLSLAVGKTYHLASLENVRLAGGLADNVIDAHDYTRPVTFVADAGNDTYTGGSAPDTFVFLADAPLGTDTLTGNGGRDTITFADEAFGTATTSDVELDLADPGIQVVNANLRLLLIDDFENATGGHGHDLLQGNHLANVLLGGQGDDTLEGRAGNEVYAFDTDNPWGTETIIEDAGGGNDTLDFSGTTLHSVHVNISVTTVQTVNGNLDLRVQDSGGGEGEIENIIGGSRNDILRGNSYANRLRGGPGNDLLDGKSNNDILDGGTGNDDLDGGLGLDTINETADTNFTLNDWSLTRGTGEVDTLDGIEVANLTGGPNANVFNLTGWTGQGSLNGGDNPLAPRLDTVVVQADATFILTDTSLTVSTMSGPLLLASYLVTVPVPALRPSIEVAVLTDGPGGHTIDAAAFSGATTLTGNEGDDTLIGGAGNDILRGGPGVDKLTGNRGNDWLDGGTGLDELIESLAGAAWEVDFVIQNNLLRIVQQDPAPTPVDDSIVELDFLFGLENVDLTGSPQNDSFDISGWTAGAVDLHGAGGSNTLTAVVPDPDADPEPDSVLITLTNTGITFTGSAGAITFDSIQIALLTAPAGNDVLDATAFTGAALLRGGAGDDVLMGGPGVNLLDGGEGDDRFVFRPDGALDLDGVIGGAGLDTLDFTAFSAAVTVNLSILGVTQIVVPGELQLLFTSAMAPAVDEVEQVLGGSGADVITGNSLNNTISGGAGADTIDGGVGSDTIAETADAASMILTDASLNIDGVIDNLASIEIARLTGGSGANTINASAFTHTTVLQGLDGVDVLSGGTGSDTLVGGAGDDTLRGGPGDDRYAFDADVLLGTDLVDELPLVANGNDTLDFGTTEAQAIAIDLSSTALQPMAAGNLTVRLTSNSSVENIVGGALGDTLTGNGLDNLFLAGNGDDVITGGAGTDQVLAVRDSDFVLTTSSLVMTDASGIETDTLAGIESAFLLGGASANLMDASAFTLGAVTLGGLGGNDILLGGYQNDVLRGGDGNDTLFGGGGADDVRGEAGNDRLGGSGSVDLGLGADGNDILRGGLGNDLYVFDQSFNQGTDTVIEFVNQGFLDVLEGVGISGIDIQLGLAGVQPIGPNLSIVLSGDLGAIENSFP